MHKKNIYFTRTYKYITATIIKQCLKIYKSFNGLSLDLKHVVNYLVFSLRENFICGCLLYLITTDFDLFYR